MPLAYLLDEHLRQGPVWTAIQSHNSRGFYRIDVTQVGDPGDLPLGSADQDILRWAEREQRILVSDDRSTLPEHLAQHLASGRRSPGIFTITQHVRPLRVVAFLEAAAYASDAYEWRDAIWYIP
jgi:hypothetical protein